MALGSGDLIMALDVGTSKVCCFIARDEGEDGLRVIGIGHQISHGMRAGRIVDMDGVEAAISATVHAAEQMAGHTVDRVIVNLSGGAPVSHILDAEVEISGHEVGLGDLRRVFDSGGTHVETDERELIHALPIAYSIDGEGGIRDPRGMYGEQLGARILLVTAASGALRTLHTCIARSHLDSTTPVLSSYASGLACLVDDEKRLGVTLIDMGGGATTIAVFAEGEMVFADALPIGGSHVTNDIARGLSTPTGHAERMKTLLGGVSTAPRDRHELIEVPPLGEESLEAVGQIAKSVLIGIIRPRLEETFELVRDRLTSSGIYQLAGRRVVLTGGASQLQGVSDLAADILDKQVRLGRPAQMPGLAEATGGPAFSTCAGLLLFAAHKPDDNARRAMGKAAPTAGQFGRIGHWLRENF
jgi:cell division protein FtsA